MEICRSCLAESFEPMFVSLLEDDLQLKYMELTSVLIDPSDPVSIQICFQCKRALDEFDQYKSRCIESNRILKDSLCVDRIKCEPSSEAEFTVTILQNIDEDTENVEIKQETGIEVVKAWPASGKVARKRGRPKKAVTTPKPEYNDMLFDENDAITAEDGTTNYICPACPTTFKRLGTAMKKHVHKHLVEDEIKEADPPHDVSDTIKQEIKVEGVAVDKPKSAIKIKGTPRRHRYFKKYPPDVVIANNDGTTSFKCPECPDRQFDKRANYRRHIINHMSKKNYVCDDCGQVLSGTQPLRVHKRSVHMDIRPFKCDICGLSFKTKVVLKEHTALRHGTKERNYSCDICLATFRTKLRVTGHMRQVHLKQKTHKCSDCELSFKTRAVLTTHFKNRHTDDRPFICELCGRGFGLLNSLQKHMKTHKDGRIRIRNLKCKFCDKMLLNKASMRLHHRKYCKLFVPETSVLVVEIGENDGSVQLYGDSENSMAFDFGVEEIVINE